MSKDKTFGEILDAKRTPLRETDPGQLNPEPLPIPASPEPAQPIQPIAAPVVAPPLPVAPRYDPDPGPVSTPVVNPQKGYGNWLHTFWDDIAPTLEPVDVTVLGHLYRLTAGHHRTECLISLRKLAQRVNVSRNTVKRAVSRLELRGLVVRVSSESEAQSNDDRGVWFRVPLAELTPMRDEAGSKRQARVSREPRSAAAPMKGRKETHETGLSDPILLREARRRELLKARPDATAREIENALDHWGE